MVATDEKHAAGPGPVAVLDSVFSQTVCYAPSAKLSMSSKL